MKSLKYIAGLMLVSIALSAWGQQDPHFTQYFDNTLFVNPAYAGSKGVLNVTGIHREQWVGFNGRPTSTTLSIHSPLSYESVGLGITFVNDQLGPVKQTMLYGDFSYTLKFKNKSKLAFGLKGGFNLVNINTNGLATTVGNDPNLVQDIRNNLNPNFGLGIYYHTDVWFIGASSPRILQESYDGTSGNIEKRHFFGIAGVVFPIARDWKLRPTTQAKFTEGAPLSLDMSVAGIYDDRFWIGAMYRLQAAFGVFIQYQVTQQLKAGVAADFGTQKIRKYNDGTFELLLSYDFVFNRKAIRSPRYF